MKLCIDPGHGGPDPGAQYGALREKTICLAIAKDTARLCAIAGHMPILTRTVDEYLTLEERADIANIAKADLFLSIHCNADMDDDDPGDYEAKGTEVWVYPGSSRGRKFAEKIEDALRSHFYGRKFRGIKESRHLAVLRLTNMPAALVEVAFIDTQESVKLAQARTQAEIAKALAWAVQEYAKVYGAVV